jgi:membrane protease YdiL (CAAX protease family)
MLAGHPISHAEFLGLYKGMTSSESWGNALFLLQELVMLLFVLGLLVRPYGLRVRDFILPGRFAYDARTAVKLMCFALLIILGVVLAITAVIYLMSGWLGSNPAQAVDTYLNGLEQEARLILTPEIGWLRIILVVLVAPPIEEFLFRGCLYSALRQRLKPWSANLMSSSIFALSHSYLAFGLPNVFIIGVLGAYTYEKTRSLAPCILFHMFWNLFCAAPVQPMLWLVLLPGLVGLYFWSRALLPRTAAQGHSLWWQAYSGAFILVVILMFLMEPADWIEGLLEVPMAVGLVAYAWAKPWGTPFFWRTYGVVYTAWSLLDLVQEIAKPAAASEPVDYFRRAVLIGALFLLMVGPAFLVLWRLCHGTLDRNRRQATG